MTCISSYTGDAYYRTVDGKIHKITTATNVFMTEVTTVPTNYIYSDAIQTEDPTLFQPMDGEKLNVLDYVVPDDQLQTQLLDKENEKIDEILNSIGPDPQPVALQSIPSKNIKMNVSSECECSNRLCSGPDFEIPDCGHRFRPECFKDGVCPRCPKKRPKQQKKPSAKRAKKIDSCECSPECTRTVQLSDASDPLHCSCLTTLACRTRLGYCPKCTPDPYNVIKFD